MKKIIAGMMVALAVAVSAQETSVSATVDFASAYVFRGATINNGLVIQPGVEVSGLPIPEEYGSLSVGIWANYDLDDNFPTDGSRGSDISEIDYYMSYTLPIEALDISVGYTEYDYPNLGGGNDQEVFMSIGSALGDSGLYQSVTAYYGLQGFFDEDLYIEGAMDYETALSDALTASAGVTVGYLIADGTSADGFTSAVFSTGLGYALNENWSVSAGLAYIAQLDSAVLGDMGGPGYYDGYDVEFVGSVGLACDF